MKIELQLRKIPVGISQCAMGDAVRFNGGHKHSKVCTELLGRCFEYVPLCPEVAIGMGVPRKPIHLQIDQAGASADQVRVVGVEDHRTDVTAPLRDYAESVVPELQRVRGYILMQNSPSCGLNKVRRYLPNGNGIDSDGVGVFTQRLREHFPHLPMEEVGRLNDSEIRENFLTRVFAYDAWFRYVQEPHGESGEPEAPSTARAIEFYSAYKYLLLAHSQPMTRELGRTLADTKSAPLQDFLFNVRGKIMQILAHPASRKGRTNALMHSQGHLKEFLNSEEKAELQQLIEDYRLGLKPISAVLTMLRHYLPRSPNGFIHNQVLLAAEPAELGFCDFH